MLKELCTASGCFAKISADRGFEKLHKANCFCRKIGEAAGGNTAFVRVGVFNSS